MDLSVCCWALESLSPAEMFKLIADESVQYVDVRLQDVASPEQRAALNNSDLKISSVSLAFALWGKPFLSGDAPEATRKIAEKGLIETAQLGASIAYVIPDEDGSEQALARFANELNHLATFAQNQGVLLCLEHFPKRALSSIESTVGFLREVNHPNLKLLLDSGHAQISNESAPDALRDLGELVGFLHVNDNDGKEDLHLGLLDGVMERSSLAATLEAAAAAAYSGPVSLELSWELDNPSSAVRRGAQLLQELGAS